MPEERPRRTAHGQEPAKISASGWQLVAVQSISCLVVVLLAFVFRMVGGSAFAQLRKSFNQSIMDNSLLATLAALWENPSSDDYSLSDSDVSDDSSLPENSAEESSSLQESSGTAAATSAVPSATTADTSTKSTSAASGGKDLTVTTKKVFYAPEGASFVPLKTNRLAAEPLAKGVVSSGYGYRENPTKGGISFHQGLDIAADTGSPVASMYFGVVAETGQNASYGKYIRLYHGNGLEILYAHCSEILAQKGAVVKAGEIVAKTGSTGDSTGPHLHIEVIVYGIHYDPAGIVATEVYV